MRADFSLWCLASKLTFHSSESPQLVPIKKKTEKREAAREAKALTAARLEKSLERELIARLKSRQYGDQPLNINEDVWQAVLNREKEVEAEKELEELGMQSDETTEDEDSDALEEEMEGEEDDREFVSDIEDESDVEDFEDYEMNGAEVRLRCSYIHCVRAPPDSLYARSLPRIPNSKTTNLPQPTLKARTTPTMRKKLVQGANLPSARLLLLRRRTGRARAKRRRSRSPEGVSRARAHQAFASAIRY